RKLVGAVGCQTHQEFVVELQCGRRRHGLVSRLDHERRGQESDRSRQVVDGAGVPRYGATEARHCATQPGHRIAQRRYRAAQRRYRATQRRKGAFQVPNIPPQVRNVLNQSVDRLEVQALDSLLYLVSTTGEGHVLRAEIRGDGQLTGTKPRIDPGLHRWRVGVRSVEGKHTVRVGLHDPVGERRSVEAGQVGDLLTAFAVVPDGDVVGVPNQLDHVEVVIDVGRGPHQ